MSVAADPIVFPRRRIKNAVLARDPLRLTTHYLVRFRAGSSMYPRGALIAYVENPLLLVISTHLGTVGAERTRNADELLRLVNGSDLPVILGGDLNSLPTDRPPRKLGSRLTDSWALLGGGSGWTFPAGAPEARIDYLFVSPSLRPVRVQTLEGLASDHLMVIVDLEGPGSPDVEMPTVRTL